MTQKELLIKVSGDITIDYGRVYLPNPVYLDSESVAYLAMYTTLVDTLDSLRVHVSYQRLAASYTGTKGMWTTYLTKRGVTPLPVDELLAICKTLKVSEQVEHLPTALHKHLKSLRPKPKTRANALATRKYLFNALDLEMLKATLSTAKHIPATAITAMLAQTTPDTSTALLEQYLDLLISKLKVIPKSLFFTLGGKYDMPVKYESISAYTLGDLATKHSVFLSHELATSYSTDTPFIPTLPIITDDERTLTRILNVIQILTVSKKYPMLLSSLIKGLTDEQKLNFQLDIEVNVTALQALHTTLKGN